jgi:hypothetical protein
MTEVTFSVSWMYARMTFAIYKASQDANSILIYRTHHHCDHCHRGPREWRQSTDKLRVFEAIL